MTRGTLLDHWYPETEDGVRFRDGTMPFYSWLKESTPDPGRSRVLNLGAGPGTEPARAIRGFFGEVVGLDVDPAVLENPDVDQAFVYDGLRFPFEDETYDVCVSDWTMEHIERPTTVLAEIFRVLKSGGLLTFRTPNKYHYVTIGARIIPDRFHIVANRMRLLEGPASLPHETYYRLNSRGLISSELGKQGFVEVEARMVESYPSYLLFNRRLFALGTLYERFVNASPTLAWLRHTILIKARKP
ncbi:MAG: class I SAM-dependent methyltransferase [Actinobacteria bacterium]|nr:class I SAM-dependent methyltransferase [Actinomycetota bacterium]